MSDDEIKKVFARNLNNYLSIKGKTQADLYKNIGVSSATASNWCNGKKVPRLDKIQAICDWLHIEKSDLLEKKLEVRAEPVEQYYLDDDAREMAQFMYDNPEYKVLFDASRKVKKEDIEFVKQMLDRFKKD